jgi:hypothetical protein
MSRLTDQRKKQGAPIPANPLPKTEGDSSDTEYGDENDTPPGKLESLYGTPDGDGGYYEAGRVDSAK